jgi:hypothetical protein
VDHRSIAPSLEQETHVFQFRGSFVPAYIHGLMAQRKITASELAVFCIVDTLSKGEAGCYATNGYLAASSGVEKRTVIRAVQKLEKLGVLTSELRGRNRRTLRVVPAVFTRSAEQSDDDSRSDISVRGGVTFQSLHKNSAEKKKKHHNGRGPVSAPRGRMPDGSGTLPRPEEDTAVLTDMGQPAITKPSDPIPADYVRAERLKRIVTTNTLMRVGGSVKNWARDMRQLRCRIVGGDAAQRIDAALDHIEQHWKEERCPKPSCPLQLMRKLPAIEQAIQIKAKSAQAPVTLSPQAEETTARLLKELDWPEPAVKNLGGAVQRSFDKLNQFVAAAERISKKSLPPKDTDLIRKSTPESQLAEDARALFRKMRPDDETIFRWFERVHEKLARYEKWGGGFDNQIWSVEHKAVQMWFSHLMAGSGGDALWEALLKELDAEGHAHVG